MTTTPKRPVGTTGSIADLPGGWVAIGPAVVYELGPGERSQHWRQEVVPARYVGHDGVASDILRRTTHDGGPIDEPWLNSYDGCNFLTWDEIEWGLARRPTPPKGAK